MKDDNRIFFIDNLKVFLILLVVFGHLIERYIDIDDLLRGIYFFIYLFHMPLFVFTTGVLSKNSNKDKISLIKSLLIPYIVFNLILYIFSYIFYPTNNFIPIIHSGWTLWFLLSLFFWKISLKYLLKIPYILPLSFLLGLVIGLFPIGDILSISRTFYFLPFFLLGYYFDFKYLNYISKHNFFYRTIAILSLLIFFLISLFISKNNIINYKFLYSSISYISLGYSSINGFMLRLLLYIISIITSFFICILISTKKQFYSKIAKNTMYIYLFHIYPIATIFYFIPTWNKNLFTIIIILISPILLVYVLSRSIFKNIYNKFFHF